MKPFFAVTVLAALMAVLALSASAVAATGSDTGIAVKAGGIWYWSQAVADAAFPEGYALTDTMTIDHSHCHGIGASIASSQVDVDLFHRFRCVMTVSTFYRRAKFDAAVSNAANVAAKREAEAKRAQYNAHGDVGGATITFTVTGRHDLNIS